MTQIVRFIHSKTLPLFVCLVVIAIFYPLNFWFKGTVFWSYFFSNYQLAENQLCEFQITNAVIRQPLNTISNIFYLFFSVEIFIMALRDRKRAEASPNLLIANYQYSIIYGICFFLLFICSSLYHASLLDLFSQLDMAGVYASILFPLYYTIHKIIAAKYYLNKPYFSFYGSLLFVFFLLLSIYIFTINFWQDSAYYVIASLSAALIFSTAYHLIFHVKDYTTNYILVSIVTATFAVSFYALDKVFCNAMSYFQLHSVWHFLSSLSLFYYYLYLRSERNLVHEVEKLKANKEFEL